MTMPPLRDTSGIPADDRGWREWLSGLTDSAAPNSSGPHAVVQGLRPDYESPRAARDVTKLTLRRWGLAKLYDDAAVVVSELVTNAVRHCGACGPLRLILVRHGPHLVCMVTDHGEQAPRMREPDWIAETGRGLHIIEAMARAWGWTPVMGGGKAVWASFPIT